MGKSIFIKVFIAIVVLVIVFKVVSASLIEPWIKEKIQTTLNEKNTDYN